MLIAIRLALIAFCLVSSAVCSINYITADQLPCHNVTKEGIGRACCDGSTYDPTWGQACNGDLQGDTPGGACEANEVLGYSAFQASYAINTGDICYVPGNCSIQQWWYIFPCCPCPAGYKIYSAGNQYPNCDAGAMCVGCTGPNEVLTGQDDSNGYSCVTTTPTSTKTSTTSKAASTSTVKTTGTSTAKTTSSKSSSKSSSTTTSKPAITSTAKISTTLKTSTSSKKA